MNLELKPISNALRRSKAGALMLLLQIAITTAIVSNAAFIIYDRIQYLEQETGYPEDEVFRVGVLNFGTDVDIWQQIKRDVTFIKSIPGVENASFTNHMPLSGSGSATGMRLNPPGEDGLSVRSSYFFMDESGIDSLGLTISEGRNFRASEVNVSSEQGQERRPSVAVVSKQFLDALFPQGDGLGSTMYFDGVATQIVGVVDKMKGPWLQDRASDHVVIMPPNFANARYMLAVRAKADERATIMREIEDKMLSQYDQRVIFGVNGLDELKADYNAGDMLMKRMLIVLISVLVAVTAVGIFGLTVFNINKRTKQIGTRRALGGRRSDIVRYFLLENTMISLTGVIFGAIGALYLGDFLFDTYSLPSLELSYVLATTVFVMLISLLSVVFPASKAANISPSIATRSV
jgi:putative ABC transport system permease protein